MATNRTIRFKTDITTDTKVSVDLKGKTYRSGKEASFPEADAKALVEGGFADYLDSNGSVIYEKNITPAPGSLRQERRQDTDASKTSMKGKASAKEEKTEDDKQSRSVAHQSESHEVHRAKAESESTRHRAK